MASEGAIKIARMIAILSAFDASMYSKFLAGISKAQDLDIAKKIATSAYVSSVCSGIGGTADVLHQVANKLVEACATGAFLDLPEDARPELIEVHRAARPRSAPASSATVTGRSRPARRRRCRSRAPGRTR